MAAKGLSDSADLLGLPQSGLSRAIGLTVLSRDMYTTLPETLCIKRGLALSYYVSGKHLLDFRDPVVNAYIAQRRNRLGAIKQTVRNDITPLFLSKLVSQ